MTFDFTRQSVSVNHYYFYVQDPEWGPAFVKVGTYLQVWFSYWSRLVTLLDGRPSAAGAA